MEKTTFLAMIDRKASDAGVESFSNIMTECLDQREYAMTKNPPDFNAVLWWTHVIWILNTLVDEVTD